MTSASSTILSRVQAESIIESLRKGVPPSEYVQHFTVGREAELNKLSSSLSSPRDGVGSALLVKANYGAGKTHLLNVIREMALGADYAVALVTMDSAGGVRANRMDQVFGAICRAIETPGAEKGIGGFLDLVVSRGQKNKNSDEWKQLSDDGRWSMSDYLASSAMFLSLRAWAHRDRDAKRLVVDFLCNPEAYKSDRKTLYRELVLELPSGIRDPRSERLFYMDGHFVFSDRGYEQSWQALGDLDKLARIAGLNGVVLLVDEFEDVVQNLNNRDYQQAAFVNLFRFFEGRRFPGMSYFAVTPDFTSKCKNELMRRQVYEFPVERFDKLPTFAMSTVQPKDMVDLARRIRAAHAAAYEWDAESAFEDVDIVLLIGGLTRRSTQDQTRQAIVGIVEHLDGLLEENV